MPTSTTFLVPLRHLNEFTSDEVRADVLRLAGRKKADELHLDCREVHSITSAGLGMTVGLNRHLRDHGVRLVLCNVRDELVDLFRVTRLDTLLDVRGTARSIQDAAEPLQEHGQRLGIGRLDQVQVDASVL